jgi:hypothetical protein
MKRIKRRIRIKKSRRICSQQWQIIAKKRVGRLYFELIEMYCMAFRMERHFE